MRPYLGIRNKKRLRCCLQCQQSLQEARLQPSVLQKQTKRCGELAKDLQGQFCDLMFALERTPDFSGIEFCSFDIRIWVFVLNSRQALNSGYFFLSLPNAGTAGMRHHIQLNRDFWCSIKYQSRRFCLIGREGSGNDRDPPVFSSLTVFPQSEF